MGHSSDHSTRVLGSGMDIRDMAVGTKMTATTIVPRELRPYQLEAVAAVESDWDDGYRRVGVVLATGLGKSTVGGKLISNAYRAGQRVLVLAHRAELLDQFCRDTMAVDPNIPEHAFGHVRAEHNDVDAPIVFATFQTLAQLKRRRAVGRRDVIIVDETHHLVATGYHATFRELGGYDSALMCGLTATMARADAKADQVGLGDVIEKISYERDLQWAIENGYLVKPNGLTVRIPGLNKLNEIPNVAGDFNQGRLAEVMEAAVGYTIDAIEQHARDRSSIVFAASVKAAYQIARRLNDEQELRARAITGEMSYNDRLPYYRKFREGKLDVLVTVAVLTEGADFPRCDCVVIARPTRSPLLYSQMVGRALRPLPGKDDALVLDLSGVTAHMKLVNLTDLGVKDLDLIEVDTDGNEVVPEPEPTEPRIQLERIARDGVVDMMPVDLFGYGHTLWLRTPAGVSFMPLPDQFIAFIWPYDGNPESREYAAGWLSTKTGLGEFIDVDEDGKPAYRPMATAIAKASKWAEEAGHQLPVRKAGWRSGSRAPSDKQLRLAAMLAIPNAARMSRGRVSDEISIAFAARWLDRRMKAA